MAELPITIACGNYDRTKAIIDGRVKVEGCDINYLPLYPEEIFHRLFKFQEFDVAEMSFSSYIRTVAAGTSEYIGIPAFVSRLFRHSGIYVRADAGIQKPEDLKGKRVGTTQYSSTALTYMRGMLQHEYGVRDSDMHWFMGGLNTFTEKPLIPLDLPERVKLDFLPPGQTLEAMFEAGELDALLSIYIPNLFLDGSPKIARLFPNFKQAEQEYYRKTRIFPIMHTIVLREDVYREHPWAARSLYNAFSEAKDLAVNGLYDTDALHLALPWLLDHVEEAWRVFGKDFWSYGLEPNRETFTAIGQYVHDQGLSPRVVSAEELFPAEFR